MTADGIKELVLLQGQLLKLSNFLVAPIRSRATNDIPLRLSRTNKAGKYPPIRQNITRLDQSVPIENNYSCRSRGRVTKLRLYSFELRDSSCEEIEVRRVNSASQRKARCRIIGGEGFDLEQTRGLGRD